MKHIGTVIVYINGKCLCVFLGNKCAGISGCPSEIVITFNTFSIYEIFTISLLLKNEYVTVLGSCNGRRKLGKAGIDCLITLCTCGSKIRDHIEVVTGASLSGNIVFTGKIIRCGFFSPAYRAYAVNVGVLAGCGNCLSAYNLATIVTSNGDRTVLNTSSVFSGGSNVLVLANGLFRRTCSGINNFNCGNTNLTVSCSSCIANTECCGACVYTYFST